MLRSRTIFLRNRRSAPQKEVDVRPTGGLLGPPGASGSPPGSPAGGAPSRRLVVQLLSTKYNPGVYCPRNRHVVGTGEK